MLILREHLWYAWQMMPGYGMEGLSPYFSPILVRKIVPGKTGKSLLQLSFHNAMYADGGKEFELTLKIRTRSSEFLIAEIQEPSQVDEPRAAIISGINFEWIRRFTPAINSTFPLERCSGFARSAAVHYLDEAFRVSPTVGRLFEEPPLQYGLRGDPYLWVALRDQLNRTPLPATEKTLKKAIAKAFEKQTGHSLETEKDFYVEKYAHGGMSSGYVSVDFWRNRAMPLLVDRFKSALSGD